MQKKIQILLVFVLFGFSSLIQANNIENEPDNTNKKDSTIKTSASSWEVDDQGKATYIVDGDTFDVSGVGRIRMADIDAPESGDPGYQAAKNYLNSSIYDVHVYLDIDDIYRTGPFGRIIAVTYITYNSTHYLNVNKDLVDKGYAVIDNYDNEYNPSGWTLYVTSPASPGDGAVNDDDDDDDDDANNINIEKYYIVGIIMLSIIVPTFVVILLLGLYNAGILSNNKTNRESSELFIQKKDTPYYDYSRKQIRAIIRAETDKALLLNLGGDKNYWIPKSTIHSRFTSHIIQPQNFIIDTWILKKSNVETGNLEDSETLKNNLEKESILESSRKNIVHRGKIIRGLIINQSERALHIKFENGREEWIPKSMISSFYNTQDGQMQDFYIEEWMLKKIKLI